MKLFLLFSILFTYSVYSQEIYFDYDGAGNQILRTLVFNTSERLIVGEEIEKEVSEKEIEKQSFFDEDIISYYPNPVKEELFLYWQLLNNNNVSEINMFSINGQHLFLFKNIEQRTEQMISFKDYPAGIYFIHLTYKTGEVKSIKVIKK